MDEFERKLRNLPWRRPSDDLRERIFGRQPRWTMLNRLFNRRIAMRWAAVFALAAGFAGYVLGTLGPETGSIQSISAEARTDFQLIETSSDRNSFDLTSPSHDFLAGKLIMTIEGPKEIKG